MSGVINIAGRKIGPGYRPLVIAEIGINHDGYFKRAVKMIHDAKECGVEVLKFQSHILADEMIYNEVVPANAKETIYDMMQRCAFTEEQEIKLKELTESLGMIYLSTPFSRAAADRLERMNVPAYKIGSGECNNYPLIEHIAKKGKPIILSTGMNDMVSIQKAVDILEDHDVEYALMHCTSMYPTPYDKVRLGAISQFLEFYNCPIGLSDHSMGNYTSFAAVALGASIIEKHFTSDASWSGPDIPISLTPAEMKDLIKGCDAVYAARGGKKTILKEEQPTIDFAYACVVTIAHIEKGETFTKENLWVKRPGTGEIKAVDFESILGKKATRAIAKNKQLIKTDFK